MYASVHRSPMKPKEITAGGGGGGEPVTRFSWYGLSSIRGFDMIYSYIYSMYIYIWIYIYIYTHIYDIKFVHVMATFSPVTGKMMNVRGINPQMTVWYEVVSGELAIIGCQNLARYQIDICTGNSTWPTARCLLGPSSGFTHGIFGVRDLENRFEIETVTLWLF